MFSNKNKTVDSITKGLTTMVDDLITLNDNISNDIDRNTEQIAELSHKRDLMDEEQAKAKRISANLQKLME